MVLAEKEMVEEMEIDGTREARHVSEQKNSAKQNVKTNNLATAICVLTEVLREGERDEEVNEKGKKHLQKAMKAMKEVKTELCDQLLRRMEQATSASMHQNLHNKLNGAPTWASVAVRGEPSVKTISMKTLREDIKAELAVNNGWMHEWGDKACMKREMYAVLVKSASLNVIDWGTLEWAVESVYKQNSTLWCRALIHKVNKIIVKQQKPHGSIIINQYGYIARFCQREETCSHCAQKGHSDKTCPGVLEGSKLKCSNCGGNHTAWNLSCSERKAVTKSVKEALIERPKCYEIRASDAEGFNYSRKRNRPQQDESVKTLRRAGRPTDIARAGVLQ
ncbi:hypothetical protein GX50_08884 [[Emmonsia] crescens]|uniref:CCHC-type domain-containing protein n=1 Tax=[Emmonsia] crescens TaxID=73230 RepID=A0A2B7Z565_9EURO|nr:hypothetical protein GX50_08884 [Emmonsia crescens]